MPIAGVKGAAAKSIQINESKMAKPITTFITEASEADNPT